MVVLAGHVSWVCSDHACCRDELKFGVDRDDVFLARSGFGGTESLLPGLVTEGRRRGLPYPRIAELLSWNPAQRYGFYAKGTIDVGYADLVLVDPNPSWVGTPRTRSPHREFPPFEGSELAARINDVFLRGRQILAGGSVVGEPTGRVRSPDRVEDGVGPRGLPVVAWRSAGPEVWTCPDGPDRLRHDCAPGRRRRPHPATDRRPRPELTTGSRSPPAPRR